MKNRKNIKKIEEEPKPKRKRRTKAEMEEYRKKIADPVVTAYREENPKPKRKRRTKAEMMQSFKVVISDPVIQKRADELLPSLPKRKRRTKAEMQEEGLIKGKIKVDRKEILKSFNNSKPNDILLKFKQYTVKRYDDFNIALYYRVNGKEVFIGYYAVDKVGITNCLTNIATKIIVYNDAGTFKALSDINTIIVALADFEKFLKSLFKQCQ